MTTMTSQITSLTIVYSTVYSDADQRKQQSSASLAFVWGIHWDRWIPAQRTSYAENVSIWWRHHVVLRRNILTFELHIYSRLDKNLWLLLGAIRPTMCWKYFMQEVFCSKINSHPGLLGINALKWTTWSYACQRNSIQEDFPREIIPHPELSRIKASCETNNNLVPCGSKGCHFVRI